MRVVIADDSMLLREGLARLLTETGVLVDATFATGVDLVVHVERDPPDVAIVDIRMPPTFTDEGLLTAQQLRRDHPQVGVLVLSQHLEAHYAVRLLEDVPDGVGYLLKDRVSDVAVLGDALQRICDGECVIDPTIVSRLMKRRRQQSPLDDLTDRERTVLTLMAEGRTNRAIGATLSLSAKTVETHVGQIFQKLGLPPSTSDHRRVMAVVAHLRASRPEDVS
jgi:DNA-binding NarL/FixJ family response regulator